MAFAIEPSDSSGSSGSEPHERLSGGSPAPPGQQRLEGGQRHGVSSVEQWPLAVSGV